MTTLITILGAALIFLGLRDIFQQLFHPSGGGSLSRLIMQALWGIFRRLAMVRRSLLVLAGPTIVLSIIVSWTALLAVGWALLYWPRLPERFSFAPGLAPANQDSFVDALYFSLMSLSTVGYGDITPTTGWLQIASTVEALVGFGLLTAALSWIISIYPVLARRTTFAREVSLIEEAERKFGSVFDRMNAEAVGRMLESLNSGVLRVRTDLVQFPVTYYFHNIEERFSFPVAMPDLLQLARTANEEDQPPEVRQRASTLLEALGDFSEMISSKTFLRLSSNEPDKVLRAYARHHLHEPRKTRESE